MPFVSITAVEISLTQVAALPPKSTFTMPCCVKSHCQSPWVLAQENLFHFIGIVSFISQLYVIF